MYLLLIESLPPRVGDHAGVASFYPPTCNPMEVRRARSAVQPLPHPWFVESWEELSAREWDRTRKCITRQRPQEHRRILSCLWGEVSQYDERTIWQLCYRVYANCDDVAARLARRLDRHRDNIFKLRGFGDLSEDSAEDREWNDRGVFPQDPDGVLPDPDAEPTARHHLSDLYRRIDWAMADN